MEIKVPKMFPNDENAIIFKWLSSSGDWVEKDQDLVDLEFSKAAVTLQAPTSGYLNILVPENTETNLQTVIAEITPSKLTSSLGSETKKGSRSWQKKSIQPTTNILSSKRIEIRALTDGNRGALVSCFQILIPFRRILENIKRMSLSSDLVNAIVLTEITNLAIKDPNLHKYYLEGDIKSHMNPCLGLALNTGRGVKIARMDLVKDLSVKEASRWMFFAAVEVAKKTSVFDKLTDSFTVSFLLDQKILFFNPLLNRHQSIVFGVGGDFDLDSSPLSFNISFDHRVHDGLYIAQLCQKLRKALDKYRDPNYLDSI